MDKLKGEASAPKEGKASEGTVQPPLDEKEDKGVFDFLKYRTLSDSEVREIIEELREQLLESDLSFDVTEKILEDLKSRVVGKKVRRGEDAARVVIESLKSSFQEILEKEKAVDPLEEVSISGKPYVIVFFGTNGVGKTTTIAKFAYAFKSRGLKVIVAAADTFRAAAQEQLAYHCSKLEVPLVKGKYGGDPAAVAFDALSAAKSRNYDVVLIDTAGRIHTDRDLVEELRRIVRIVKPHRKLLVIDSLSGSDAVNQAKYFAEAVDFDGIVLTKVDADVKGGLAISLVYEVRKPILYLGVGQSYEDMIKFEPSWILNRIFG